MTFSRVLSTAFDNVKFDFKLSIQEMYPDFF